MRTGGGGVSSVFNAHRAPDLHCRRRDWNK